MINIIVAINKKGYIGRDNKLMWHNSEDLKLFKQMTLGKTLIMGRKTWESLPTRPLRGRQNIIITTTENFKGLGYDTWGTVDFDFLKNAEEEYWVIGGENIYNQFLPYADKVFVSIIDDYTEGDKKFDYQWVKDNMTCKLIKYGKTFKQKIYERESR